MDTVLLHYFEALKQNLLVKAGITNILPSECKALSDSIFKKTNKRISETTLKRVYGFAYSKFNPSLFTIDAMAQFCDYLGWTDFCEKQEIIPPNKPVKVCWNTIKQNAHKVTHYTLQALKNRSGIPYNYTIKRKFVDDQFNAFIQNNYTATAFIAPSGYGKTLALCHWIDEQLELNIQAKKNDIILFFSSNALVNSSVSGRNLSDWLLSLLGYDGEGDIIELLNDDKKREGNFYLVIDNFDEHIFKNNQFQLLLNEIVDIISLYKIHSWFKIILTMRSTTWTNNKHIIINGYNNWFPGFISNENRAVNVPLFNVEEIQELCEKINPEKEHTINLDVAKFLDNPLYFQFYYQLHADNFSLKKFDQLNIYELISSYILNKIYLGPHSSEKLLLIYGLINDMDFKNKVYTVNKLKVYSLIKRYHHAYHDLLSLGFLRELNTSNDLKFDNYIEFGNNNFLDYAIAQVFLFNNDDVFDDRVIMILNELLTNNSHKLAVLKWCIMYAIKNGQHENLKHIKETCLSAIEKSELLLFISDLFEKKLLYGPGVIEKQFIQNFPHELFDYFLGIEFINTDYEQSLQTLLKFELTNSRKIAVYTSLTIIAIIQMDMDKFEAYLSELKSFPANDFDTFPVNPLNCLETIYIYLRYGIVKTEAFIELTKFYFNPPVFDTATTNNSTNDVIYLLATYTLSINQNPHKTLRFISAINKIYKKTTDYPKGYSFLLKLIMVEARFSIHNSEEGLKIYNQVLKDFDKDKNAYTPFMKSLFYLLKVKVTLLTEQKPDVLGIMKPLVHLSDESGYKLIKIFSLVLILSNPAILKDDVNYYKKVYHDFTKIVGESGFRGESFFKTDMIKFPYLVN
ncbi:MAG: hypothetical protein JWQ79_2736 [Mucilaginibacter sp.]|nr:hypothetical protein [Mucilaginibacter sp.]